MGAATLTLTVGAILLWASAIAEYEGYLSQSLLGGVSTSALAFFGVLCAIAAIVSHSADESRGRRQIWGD